jgi:NAD(P)-dependent dehydrogenase (short-subunit alcohol dehydrogenase family)
MRNALFITGASSGIGRAAVKVFAANGWNVVATMRNPDMGAELSALSNVLVARLDLCGQVNSREAPFAKRWPTDREYPLDKWGSI